MIRIPKIAKDLEKYLTKDYLKSEIRKIKTELKSMDLYKKIPEPTLKHISQLEDQFTQLSKKITQTQKQVDKEFNNAFKMMEKGKEEASVKIGSLRDYAFEQKTIIEDLIRTQLQSISGGSIPKAKAPQKSTAAKKAKKKKVRKKKTSKKASSKKVAKKASRKKASSTKKKATKKKVAKKVTVRKKKTSSRKKS